MSEYLQRWFSAGSRSKTIAVPRQRHTVCQLLTDKNCVENWPK